MKDNFKKSLFNQGLGLGKKLMVGTIDAEMLKNKDLFAAERECRLPLRIAFFALLCCCDSKGRFYSDPEKLKPSILPYDDVDVSKVLDALFSRGFIKKYQHQAKMYAYIPLGGVPDLSAAPYDGE